MSQVLELTKQLVALPSVTPDDLGCQALMIARLEALGFRIERMRFGEVDNFWARLGTQAPLLCFAGHTDVVPSGPAEAWRSSPFVPTERDGALWGRGTADMKAGLAAMVVACEEYLRAGATPAGSIAFLITSDEEGPAKDGTKAVIEALEARGEKIDWCLVGEPSSRARLGDILRIGRRGSLSGDLVVRGVQGHVAYPDTVVNPLHKLAPVLAELVSLRWDAGNDAFPPTSFQLTNLHSGTGFRNVVPGSAELKFNIRYSTEQSFEGLQARIHELLDRHELDYTITWRDAGRPFLTRAGPFLEAVREVVRNIAGVDPELSTGGGTSDGRFIAPTGAAVVELGPINASIHKIDEHVRIADLEPLKDLYLGILRRLL